MTYTQRSWVGIFEVDLRKKEGQRTFRNWKPKKRKEKQENFGQNINKNIPVVAVGYQDDSLLFMATLVDAANESNNNNNSRGVVVHPIPKPFWLKKRQNQHNIRCAHICVVRHLIIYSSLHLDGSIDFRLNDAHTQSVSLG